MQQTDLVEYAAMVAEMLTANVLVRSADDRQSITLKEHGANATLRSIAVTHLGKDSFAVLPDRGLAGHGRYSHLFRQEARHVWNQGCDAVIHCRYRNHVYRIYIELKSGNSKGASRQILGAECFLAYLDEIIQRARDKQPPEFITRCVVLKKARSLSKRPTSVSPTAYTGDELRTLTVQDGTEIAIVRLLG
jgi:hypothetical protein